MKELSKDTRREVFNECGVPYSKRKSTHNVHHVIQKRDVRDRLVPKNFPVNDRSNLIVLPIITHNQLHEIIDSNPEYVNDISLRVYFANMAFCGDLSDVPDRMYHVMPQVRKATV
jgi:hypothetical protein